MVLILYDKALLVWALPSLIFLLEGHKHWTLPHGHSVQSLRVTQGGQGSVAGLPQKEAESGIHRLGWGCGCTQALSLEAGGLGL